jgi:hypothetical protein
MRLHQVQGHQAQVRGPRGYQTCAGRRRRVQGAAGALNAAQTLCLNSASFWRGVWCLTWLLLKLLPLLRLRGGRALRWLWMPLRLRLRLRMTIESRARCWRIKETLIGRYRHIQTNIQANTGKYELRKSAFVPVCGGTNHEKLKMCIYLFEYRQIQAQIMKMYIYFSQYRQIQANMES